MLNLGQAPHAPAASLVWRTAQRPKSAGTLRAPVVVVGRLEREADDVVVRRVRCYAYLQPCGGKVGMIR